MKKIKSLNPYNSEILKEYDLLTDEEVLKKLEKTSTAFEDWRESSLQEKSSFLTNASEYLMEHQGRFAKIISSEMGKPIKEAFAEVEKCSWVCRYYVHHAAEHLEDVEIDTEAQKSYIHYQPLGGILAVMPWNFPFWQVFRFAAPAVMAGNVCVLKHASNVPQCSMAIEEVFEKSGFPKGVFQSLLIDNSQVENIISHRAIAAVTLTGSEKAGSIVASMAGKYIKKSVMELGGSDPFIVLEDADLDLAVEKAIDSRMINTGQSCIAAKRFIVVRQVYDEFKTKILEKIKSLKVGDQLDEENQLGPMARPDLAAELWDQVENSIKKGAKALIPGKKPKKGSSVFHPVVLENIKPGIPAFDEELFGPVFCLMRVENEEKAISFANNSNFGLGASLWTKNTIKAATLAAKINSGAVFINEMVKSDPRLPFGGVKKSGYGRELSSLGIREFVNAKTIWIN